MLPALSLWLWNGKYQGERHKCIVLGLRMAPYHVADCMRNKAVAMHGDCFMLNCVLCLHIMLKALPEFNVFQGPLRKVAFLFFKCYLVNMCGLVSVNAYIQLW